MKKFLLIVLIVFGFNIVNAQFLNEFEKGFNVGFKQGYCYDKNVNCLSPLTPLPPLPSINESDNSFQDGYNRGFLVGKSERDYDDNAKYNLTPNVFKGYKEPIKPNNYQGSVDLGLMTTVLQYKQSLFDARADWIQQRIDDLSTLNYSLLYQQDRKLYEENKSKIDNFISTVNINEKGQVDWSNSNQFAFHATLLSNIEKSIISSAYDARKNSSFRDEQNLNKSKKIDELTPTYKGLLYFQKAQEYWGNNNTNGALEQINKSIEVDPNDNVYNFRGIIYLYGIKNFDEAIRDFTKVIQMHSTFDSISNISFFYRGMAYFREKKYFEAIKDFTTCITMNEDNTDAYFMRGLAKSFLKDKIGTIKDYDAIIEREKKAKPTVYKMSTVYNNKAYCLVELGKYRDALPLVNKALSLNESESFIWDTRGEIYYEIGEYEKCVKDMSKAIEINIQSENSYYYRGLANIKLGKKLDGCSDLSKAGEYGKKEAYEKIKVNCK